MIERIAKQVAQRLHEAGFQALYAGGWVRDYLLGIESNDIDIATDATPDEVVELFPKAILVGAQFGVIRVIEHGHEFEIATFRLDAQYSNGRTPETVHLIRSSKEDALRRDFTINGMFYDPFTEEIIDYVGGQEDLQANIIRTIGNPIERFLEDRLRMIRAIRFANTFNAHIEEKTWEAIQELATTLRPSVSPERIWQELNKIHITKKLSQALRLFEKAGLLREIFPHLKNASNIGSRIELIERTPSDVPLPFLISLLVQSTDSISPEECIASYNASKQEMHMASFLNKLQTTLPIQGDDAFWAELYAHPFFDDALRSLLQNKDDMLLEEHVARKKDLSFWVDRIREKKPIVSASDLLALGHKPGKELGILLKQLAATAINKRIKSKEELL